MIEKVVNLGKGPGRDLFFGFINLIIFMYGVGWVLS